MAEHLDLPCEEVAQELPVGRRVAHGAYRRAFMPRRPAAQNEREPTLSSTLITTMSVSAPTSPNISASSTAACRNTAKKTPVATSFAMSASCPPLILAAKAARDAIAAMDASIATTFGTAD